MQKLVVEFYERNTTVYSAAFDQNNSDRLTPGILVLGPVSYVIRCLPPYWFALQQRGFGSQSIDAHGKQLILLVRASI